LAEHLPAAPETETHPEALTHYCIDRQGSRIAAIAFAMGTRHEIRIREFSGSLQLARDGSPRRLSLLVKMTTAEGAAEWITELIRSERFLHVTAFPTARFESTQIRRLDGELTIEGALTLRGVTRRLRVHATASGDLAGAAPVQLQAQTSFAVDRHAFGIEPGAPHEWVLSDEVDVELTLRADLAHTGGEANRACENT
jgi:polyisoprenoid-binding protein YceI